MIEKIVFDRDGLRLVGNLYLPENFSFVAFTFDYSQYGESDGEPRQWECNEENVTLHGVGVGLSPDMSQYKKGASR